jgi:hypothetical protein
MNAVRKINAVVELSNGSTISSNDILQSFEIQRTGEGKFFGYGYCQKLNIKLIDVNRERNFTTSDTFKIYLNNLNDYPTFKTTEVNRDENTNLLSITAYDLLNKANDIKVSELSLSSSYSILDLATVIASKLGAESVKYVGVDDGSFSFVYSEGANFEGSETLREALNDIAEATQTIYFIDYNNDLVFKRLDKDGEPLYTINKEKYFTLKSKTNRRLTSIAHITELGDNVEASGTETGTTAYVRDNAFWEKREDIDNAVETALAAVNGLTINQFECSWRGDFIELGNKIALECKDGTTAISYLLDETIKYDGSLQSDIKWEYQEEEAKDSNPSTLGEALKNTFAKVDKVNKQINLLVSEVDTNTENIAQLQLDTSNIKASVQEVQMGYSETIDGINQELGTLTKKVEASLTSEDVSLQIKEELDNGVDKVTTSTGFTFNEEGLTVSKSGSEMTTTITEDGMTVYRDNTEVLIADNEGVKAEDLHATTYLIIGENSRFEDYKNTNGESRTGCFWIGG